MSDGNLKTTVGSSTRSDIKPHVRSSSDWLLRRSGIYHLSGLLRFTPPADTGRPGFRRRLGLRWRLSVFLIAATLVPVIAVAAVSIALVFSSVEQGIQVEAQRALQVARGLLLQEVRERATAAAALGDDLILLDALDHSTADVRLRLAELSEQQQSALVEVTDAGGRPAGAGYLEMTGYAHSLGGKF